jgi:hypothetical protein
LACTHGGADASLFLERQYLLRMMPKKRQYAENRPGKRSATRLF